MNENPFNQIPAAAIRREEWKEEMTAEMNERNHKLVAATEKGHNVKIGDIFSMSWGYDQTNVNYFQVVSVTAKGVYVREIGACSVPGTQGFMCEEVKPAKDRFLERSQWCGGFNGQNEPTFRRIQPGSNNQPYFNFKGRYFARPVAEGESTYNSWYA